MKLVLSLITGVALLSGCVTSPPAQPAALATPVTLQPHQRAVLPDGTTLTYTGVRNDSRCKPNVVCVWAGKADVDFTYLGQAISVEIPRANTHSLGIYQMEIIGVAQTDNPPVTLKITKP